GMPGYTVDGNDPLAVYEVVKKAREYAITGNGPTLIEVITYRLTAHSSDDDDRVYRKKEEIEAEKKNDPLLLFKKYLSDLSILTSEREKELNNEITDMINEATDYAEKAAYARPEDALKYVYEEQG